MLDNQDMWEQDAHGRICIFSCDAHQVKVCESSMLLQHQYTSQHVCRTYRVGAEVIVTVKEQVHDSIRICSGTVDSTGLGVSSPQ